MSYLRSSLCSKVSSTILLLFLLLLFPLIKQAKAKTHHLMLNPVRLIFNDRERTAQLSVINPTNQAEDYKVYIVPMKREKDGKWVLSEDATPQDKKISNMIRFSPRRSRIEKKSKQVVKFMLRKPADLAKGEYRARIFLSPILKPKKTIKEPSKDEKLSIGLDVQVTTSFPIIIQHKTELPTVKAVNITLMNKSDNSGTTEKLVEVEYQRKGEFSSFGDVNLFYRPTKEDDWRQIGFTRGLAIYSPETKKKLLIALKNITDEELKNGMLRLEYRHNNGRQQPKKKPDSVQHFRL